MAEADETKLCGNCKKQISANNFMMHEMHCLRHISLCKHCNEPIPKGEMEVHVEESHAKIGCLRCGVQVEKMHLEDHEENSCEKRPMKCLYCELEFPKNELESHTDYCGSRTEPCTKCGQYIRLKDQLKHDESNCTYPPIKPANNERNTNENGLTGLSGLSRPDRPFNIYGHSNNNNIPVGLNQFDMAIGGRSTLADFDIPNPVVPVVSRKDSNKGNAVSRSNVFNNNRSKKTVNARVTKRSDLNEQRGAAMGQTTPDKTDYDQLLAMHLAQDLNQDSDIDDIIRRMEKPTPEIAQNTVTNTGFEVDRFSEDLSMIPCEFCGDPFVADDLVQHQSRCSLDRISAMLPQLSAATTRADNLNNAADSSPLVVDRSPIVAERPPIIDNLRNFSADDWLDDTDPVGGGDNDGSSLLPCEFCNELFPMDILVQHQAVCDSNTTQTPRVQSPAVTRPRLPKKKTSSITNTRLTNLDRLEADLPNLMSRRHQAPPRMTLGDDSDDNDVTTGAIHRVLKPNIGAVKPPGAANIRKPMKRSGLESRVRGENVTKQGSHSRSGGEEKSTPKRTDPFRNRTDPSQNRSDPSQNRTDPSQNRTDPSHNMRLGSDDRVRGTIDGLLHDVDKSNHDLLANLASSRKTVINDMNASRQIGLPGRTAPQRGTAKPKPSTTSHNTTTTRSRTTSCYRSDDDPPFEIRTRPVDIEERTSSQRARQTRANHVFGAQSKQQKR